MTHFVSLFASWLTEESWLLRLLERDPYDEDAWTALIAAHIRLRRHGEARHQHAAYARRMAELDLTVAPFAAISDRVP